MMVWTWAVSSWDAAIQYRRGTGTDTTHWRVGTQGMTCSTRWAAVCAMRRPAQEGQNPRRLQLKASSNSCISAHMCTIENDNDLCKGLLEASSGIMVSVAESCGRDARVTSRVGAHKKIWRATRSWCWGQGSRTAPLTYTPADLAE